MDYKEIFLSRKNLLNLNSILINKLNVSNLSHDDKTNFINVLFNNMQDSYNKLKFNSINDNNLNYVKTQYNNIVINTSIQDLQQSNSQQPNSQQPNLLQPNLQQPNLQQPNLLQSNLQQSNLQQSNLQQSNLQQTNLQQTNLQQPNSQKSISEQSLDDYIKQRNKLISKDIPPTPNFADEEYTKSLEEKQNKIIDPSNLTYNIENINSINSLDKQINPIELNNSSILNNENNNYSEINLSNNNKTEQLYDNKLSIDDRLKLYTEQRNKFDNKHFDNNLNNNNTSLDDNDFSNNSLDNNDFSNNSLDNNDFNNNSLDNNDFNNNSLNNNDFNNNSINNNNLDNENSINNKLNQQYIDVNNKLNQQNINNKVDTILNNYTELLNTLDIKNDEINNLNERYDNILMLLNTKLEEINNKNNIKYKNIIIDSSNFDNKNNYTFNLPEELTNVYRIDLISYEIPNMKYNITLNNNKIKFDIGEEIDYNNNFDNVQLPPQNKNNTYGEIIIIEPDNYTIDSLIYYLNSFTESNKIYFEYINNKLNIYCIDFYNKKQYKLKLNQMPINYNLDLNDENDFVDIIKSNNNFKFKYDNYINLYLKNIIDKELKLSLILQNSTKSINLDNISINKLDIELKSNIGLNYNFKNLNHILEFNLYYK